MRGLSVLEPRVSEEVEYSVLVLKKGEDARLRAGHLWVFSNEVDTERTPLSGFTPGQAIAIVDYRDKPIGIGYVNPNSLICARLVSRGLEHPLDRSLIVHRLNIALSLRERMFDEPYYRIVFGESDGLPGLTIDRFGDVLVGQATTTGMDNIKDDIVAAAVKVLKPRQFWWKNDASIRSLEGLVDSIELAHGEPGGQVIVKENGLTFEVDPEHGQKTGWFYDQRANRDHLAKLVEGKSVLDVFSYLGGWGLRAAQLGAREVVCIDGSQSAVDAIGRNAQINGLADKVSAIHGDAFEELKRMREQREKFDVVIVDPPAFVKRKKDFREGRNAYRRINELAMQVLQREGILVTCSCSHHMPRVALLGAVQEGVRHLDRQAQLLVSLQQGPDHPVHPAIPETEYLKGFIFRVLPV